MSAIICQWSAKRKVSLSVSYSLAFFIAYSVISKFQSFQPRFVFLQRNVQVWINSTQKGRKILFGVNKIFKQRKLRGQVETEHLRSFVGILTGKKPKKSKPVIFLKMSQQVKLKQKQTVSLERDASFAGLYFCQLVMIYQEWIKVQSYNKCSVFSRSWSKVFGFGSASSCYVS